MTLESDLFARLGSLVANKVYPDISPIGAQPPYIVYQQTGGQPLSFVESAAPDKKNAEVELWIWAATRAAANALARSAEDSMVTSTTLRATTLGAFAGVYDQEVELYGTVQKFSVWY